MLNEISKENKTTQSYVESKIVDVTEAESRMMTMEAEGRTEKVQ